MRNKIVNIMLMLMLLFMVLPTMVVRTAAVTVEDTTMNRIRSNFSERTENNLLEGAMPCRGRANMIVIYVTFDGQIAKYTKDDIEGMMFGEYDFFDDGGKEENIHDYFYNISYGKLDVTGTVIERHLKQKPATKEEASEIAFETINDFFNGKDPSGFDCNGDGYIDAVLILVADILDGSRGYVRNCSRTVSEYKIANYAVVSVDNMVHPEETIGHEMIHLMGLPDIYAGTGQNPMGTQADSIMDGVKGSWAHYYYERKNCDLPGIMKFFFGWMDNIVEVYDSKCISYILPSFSRNSSAMVIYPNGNKLSKFVFFIEHLTPERNCDMLPSFHFKYGGSLRIWKVYFSVDDNGKIPGSGSSKGTGSSPFIYIESVNIDNGFNFVLQPGMEFSPESSPSSEYHESFYYNFIGPSETARYPNDHLNSNVEITNLVFTESGMSFDVSICDHIYDSVNACMKKCKKCGRERFSHVYTDIVTEPTCIEKGFTTHRCNICGYEYTDNYVDGEHIYGEAVWKNPTCTEGGYSRSVCCFCGDEKIEFIVDPIPHSYMIITTSPTCIKNGYTTYTCHFCGETYIGEEIAALGHDYQDGKCSVCGDSAVTRVAGGSRYSTCIAVANELKASLGVEKFDSVVVASGADFPDALAGTYLAAVKKAPILLIADTHIDMMVEYIDENMADSGTIYILGSENSVSAMAEEALKTVGNVKRLGGKSRFITNLRILEETGTTTGELLVVYSVAPWDALSVSSSGRPILRVNDKLRDDQKQYLETTGFDKITIIGSTAGVPGTMEEELRAYCSNIDRVYGKNRFMTSIEVAEYFYGTERGSIVVACGTNFPDGLCSGALAHAKKAPVILTDAGRESLVADYVTEYNVQSGYVIGSAKVVSDASVRKAFHMTETDVIK